MPNSSTTGGNLLPASTPAPLEGDALDDFFQTWIVALTGLDPTLIRPRWTPVPADIPGFGVNWAAFGITAFESETFAAELHLGSNDGYNETRRHEEMNCLISFYGPDSGSYAALFRDGLQVAQNREYLSLNGMGLVSSDKIIPMPELVKERWLKRFDLNFVIRRIIVRDYNIVTILSVPVSINNEDYIEQINVS